MLKSSMLLSVVVIQLTDVRNLDYLLTQLPKLIGQAIRLSAFQLLYRDEPARNTIQHSE